MPARSLVQALEGVNFPCGRTRLVEYARNNNASPRAIAALEVLPDRQYRDLTELFTALPSKSQVDRLQRQARPEQQEEQDPPSPPEDLAAEEGGMAEDEEPQQPTDPMQMGLEWSRWAMDLSLQWAQMAQRLWFPWLR